jgi:nitrogen regulatory protein PII
MIKLEITVNTDNALHIKEALTKVGIKKILLLEVKEYDEDNVHTEGYRGSSYVIEFSKKIKLEIIINSEELKEMALDSIARTNIEVEILIYDVLKNITLHHLDENGSVFSLQDEYDRKKNKKKSILKIF